MQSVYSARLSSRFTGQVLPRFVVSLGVGAFILWLSAAAQNPPAPAPAQNAPAPKETVHDGYLVHQSIDIDGRISNQNGSLPMYDTLVNMHTGPRILTQSIEMHAVPDAKHFFLYDSLLATSVGYGGDPENSTVLRMSKGKTYDFQGMFRRDREYFDYDLLGNPLIPPGVTSNGYTFPQVLQAAHLFNTVRRMTDTDLTLFPVSKVSFRSGYSQNISQGPSFSSLHNGSEAQFLQNWRNSTDSWFGAVDWKALTRTVLTFQETITHYKGNTSYQLAPAAPADCGTNTFLGTGDYDEPTQFGSIDFMFSPNKKVQLHVGYRMNAVNGTTVLLNPRQVPGSLQSHYQTPFANVVWTISRGWGFRAEWNYYDYGEAATVGPTLPRAFQTNLYTLGLHYEF